MKVELSAADFPEDLQIMVEKIGIDNTQRLVDTFAGGSVYFPRIKIRRGAIKRHVLQHLKEKPIATLVRETGVSRTTIYRYIHNL